MTIRFFLLFLIYFSFAVIIQSHMMLNWDVSYLVHASDKLFHGGHYTTDFFETNPPMILFFYLLPVLGSNFFSISLVLSMRIYIFITVFFVLILNGLLSRLIFVGKNDRVLLGVFLSSLIVTFLFLPVYEFGQREHFTIMLIFPYLLVCVLRLLDRTVPFYLACVSGILAGIGFAMKPFYLIPLCLIECTLIGYKHNFLAFLRGETIVIAFVILIYGIALWQITPDYISTVLPFLLHLYYPGFGKSLTLLMTNPFFLFCLAALLLFLITWKHRPYREFRLILCVAMVGFALAYLVAGTLWFYHLIPLFTLAVVLTAFLSRQLFPIRYSFSWNNVAYLICWVTLLWFPSWIVVEMTVFCMQKKNDRARYELIDQLKKLKGFKTCYFISTTGYSYPAVELAGKVSVSRFPNYWWLPGLVRRSQLTHDPVELKRLDHEKKYFTQTIIDDIEKKQPDLILIDTRSFSTELGNENIDYVKYFSDPKLNQLLSSYRPISDITNFAIYGRSGIFL